MLDEYKNAGTVEAEILMARTVHSGAFLIVEGETDSRFWGAHVDSAACEIVIAGGKLAALGAIERLDKRNLRGVLAVVDDDCDSVLNRLQTSPNVRATPTRDLETFLLQLIDFGRLLAEFGTPKKVRAAQERLGPLLEALIERALPFGRLHCLAARDSLAWDFKDLGPARFVDKVTWSVDLAALHGEAVKKGPHLDVQSLRADLDTLPHADPWRMVRGHDVLYILTYGLDRVLGKGGPGHDRLGSALRLMVNDEVLRGSALWESVRGWEQTHLPYRVLR